MTKINAVVFDLGHTLWNYTPSRDGGSPAILRMQARIEQTHAEATTPQSLELALGRASDRWMRDWDTPDKLEQPTSDHLVNEALAELGLNCDDGLLLDLTTILFAEDLDMPVVEPDTLATIASLHVRGIAMGCVTNTVLLESGIFEMLRRLGLVRYLDSIVVSSAMSYRKPHASLFQRALDELGVPAREAIFVGDRLIDDVGGAKAVGMRGVLTHQYRQEPLDGARVQPDAVIQRLSGLPSAIERFEAAN